jgi:hypothetical protein
MISIVPCRSLSGDLVSKMSAARNLTFKVSTSRKSLYPSSKNSGRRSAP